MIHDCDVKENPSLSMGEGFFVRVVGRTRNISDALQKRTPPSV
jgi:hypothetical protein